jgi:hypothetical protein
MHHCCCDGLMMAFGKVGWSIMTKAMMLAMTERRETASMLLREHGMAARRVV